MGLTYIEGTVTGPTGETATLDFLIDSGANYTLLPEAVWRRLGLVPKRTQGFRLADGSRIERAISQCHIRVASRDGDTPVILGEPGDRALLGVITLEELGLVFNPFDGSLKPMEEAPLMPLTTTIVPVGHFDRLLGAIDRPDRAPRLARAARRAKAHERIR